jgi:hypothetical protein
MKKLTLIILLFISIFGANAQDKTDKFKFHYDVTLGVLPIKISGTMNTANSNSDPVYKFVDTTGIMGNFGLHIGMNIPFYRTENWSIGANVNAGVGRIGSFRAAEGLNSYTLDFPQYIYYRNYKSSFDYSVLVGYKHTIAGLNYSLPLIAFGLNKPNGSFLIYSSVKRYTYYSYYTNGDIKPALKIGEMGLMIFFNLGRN